MKAELIFTGSELLRGEVVNSHAQYLGRWLSEHNFRVGLHTTVGDCRRELEQAFEQALERSDLILITGGLGPTTDDLTKEVVAHVLGLPLLLDEKSLAAIRNSFQQRGMVMPDSNTSQAYIPQGAAIIPNKRGTAPGVLLEQDHKIVILLPGPPHELTAMFEEKLVPYLTGKTAFQTATMSKVINVTGISESAVQDLLKGLGGQGNPSITYLAAHGQVQVRITAQANDAELAEKMAAELTNQINALLKDYVFSFGDEDIARRVGKQLLEQRVTIGLAESCTGGLISARLTDLPGSSGYLIGGVVAYSNEVKKALLSVPGPVIDLHGAVSEETAEAMAKGVRQLLHVDLGLAVTGVAGPDGGTAAKPRGLVYIALATADGVICRKFHFPGSRLAVRMGTSHAALNMVSSFLQKK